jgi:hypothetical protein
VLPALSGGVCFYLVNNVCIFLTHFKLVTLFAYETSRLIPSGEFAPGLEN